MNIDDALKQALALHSQIDKIHAQIDEILDPICHKVMADGDDETIRQLMHRLPTGFHKSELRVFLMNRIHPLDYDGS